MAKKKHSASVSPRQVLPAQSCAGKKPKNAAYASVVAAPGATRSERRQRGRHLRSAVPFTEFGQWQAGAARRDPIEILEQSNYDRVADLIPVRYGRMLASPFTFYRGSAALMAQDLATTPSTGIIVQACGDCHILNFGAFATPERNIVVDINDFDETIAGPWEWDVKRLAASLVIGALGAGLPLSVAQRAAELVGQAYREQMRNFAKMNILDVWYSKLPYQTFVDHAASKGERQERQRTLAEARRKSSTAAMMSKLLEKQKGKLRFKDQWPFIYHADHLVSMETTRQAFDQYRSTLAEERRAVLDRFHPVDIALKVVGIGSVATRCMVVLLSAADGDVLILQVKEARRSVYQPFVDPSPYANEGQRVVVGQRVMQSASDLFLGWTQGPKQRYFYIRQLRDVKLSLTPTQWTKATLHAHAWLAGMVLAKAHARSGDPALLRGYLGKSAAFEINLGKFAISYAEQNERDFQLFEKACRSGRLNAQSFV